MIKGSGLFNLRRATKKTLPVADAVQAKNAELLKTSRDVTPHDTRPVSRLEKTAEGLVRNNSKKPAIAFTLGINKENGEKRNATRKPVNGFANLSKLFDSPFANAKVIDRSTISTTGSDVETDLNSDRKNLFECSPKEAKAKKAVVQAIPNKTKSTVSAATENVYEPNRKAMKTNQGGKKVFKSYLPLINRATKQTEYFRLYRDSEIGFEKELQQATKESNFDDDCQTDDDQIEAAQYDLQRLITGAAKEMVKFQNRIGEKVRNSKYNPVLKAKVLVKRKYD